MSETITSKLLKGLLLRGIEIVSLNSEAKIVSCMLPHNDITPFVTWRYNDEGKTYSGNYFGCITDCQNDFSERSGLCEGIN